MKRLITGAGSAVRSTTVDHDVEDDHDIEEWW